LRRSLSPWYNHEDQMIIPEEENMSNETQSIKVEQFVKATPGNVYLAFTNATLLREWMCDFASIDPRPGGRLYMGWNAGYYVCGEFTSLDSGKSLTFMWLGRSEPAPTQVQVSLAEENGGTRIALIHSGIGNGAGWGDSIQGFAREWNNSLNNLASILETGQDLRLVRRPLLGINVGEFNADIANKLGVPVTEGIRLSGVMDGLGAQAAGLRNDDVLISLANQKLTSFTDLINVIQENKAGDTIEVTFFRGGDKKTATMTLSRRNIPDIPVDPSVLADQLYQMYSEGNTRLSELFNGVSEEQAAICPAQDEWSAKDNLAHLIHGYRSYTEWIGNLIIAQEPVAEGFGDNVQARVKATVVAFPSTSSLLDELRRSENELVSLIRLLPSEFIARKSSYWRIGVILFQDAPHFDEHLEQIKKVLGAARK
jgi:uncharacterized protein YndB with AHSA1/START domain